MDSTASTDYKPKYLLQFEFAVDIDTYHKDHVVKREYPHAKKHFGLFRHRASIMPKIKYLLTPVLCRGLGISHKDAHTFKLNWVTKPQKEDSRDIVVGYIFVDASDPIRQKGDSLMAEYIESFKESSHRLLFPCIGSSFGEHELLRVEMRRNKDLRTPEIELECKTLLDKEIKDVFASRDSNDASKKEDHVIRDYVQYFEPIRMGQVYIIDKDTEKQFRDHIRSRRLRDKYDISDFYLLDRDVEDIVRRLRKDPGGDSDVADASDDDGEAMMMQPPPAKKAKITE